MLAEELGHVLLEHQLVESTQPGKPAIGLLEPRRVFYEREARAFAAELLMPFAEIRRRWFAAAQEYPVEGELSVEKRVERLAAEFGVTPTAMRVRLEHMKLISVSPLRSLALAAALAVSLAHPRAPIRRVSMSLSP